MWFPSGCHMVSKSKACAVNVETTWCPCGNHVVCTWKPHGVHMETTWCPCGNQFLDNFHHFHVTSVAIRSQKMMNLWKPVTSLIMVRFSIREKVLKSSWSPLSAGIGFMSCAHVYTMLSCTFQSNLTPKSCDHVSQPIRRFGSMKSPSSRWNLWEIARFHWKFLSHLNSKAVITALLKINTCLIISTV